MRDENRQIAHDLDRSRAAGVAHPLPLLEEQKLRQLVQPDLSGAGRVDHRATADGSRARCPAPTSSTRPDPCASLTAMNSAKSSSQLPARGRIRRTDRASAAPPASKRSSTRGQSARRWAITAGKSTLPAGTTSWLRASASVSSPSSISRSRLIEQRVAGERRKALVRRIAVAGRPERQHLPHSLAGGSEQIDELERARAEIADAEAARQRRRMEEDAARASGTASSLTSAARRRSRVPSGP